MDPIDGTVNLMHGVPLCAVSLGLVEAGRPTVGVIDLPLLDQRYQAVLGGGAFRGDQRLQASRTSALRDALVAIGDYATGPDAQEKNRERLEVTKALIASAQRVRMLGSAAIDLLWVAEGVLDASVMLANKPWDTAAGVLIAREAGALVLDRDGSHHTMDSATTIAVSPGLRDELIAVLRDR